MTTKISAAVTTFNNEETLEKCFKSLSFCDEIVVVDSFSTDSSLDIIEKHGCTLYQQKFLGYSKQKQLAVDLCRNDWVLLLDSDERINPDTLKVIQQWQSKEAQSQADAYQIPRREWVFWKWSHPWVRKNKFLRLFKKSLASVSKHTVHESVISTGTVGSLDLMIDHYGETSIQKKLDKINKYSSFAAQEKHQKGKKVTGFKLFLYPPFYFFKQLILRRQIFNGVAGLINSALNTHYAFLKYSKLYELQKNKN